MTAEFLTAALDAPHGFFTRRGGVSSGAFASLNCSISGKDAPDLVARNRALAAEAVGARPDSLAGVTQVHGIAVATVVAPWTSGPIADALVTAQVGVTLAVVTADCAPVLFADARHGVVGAAHAGWRGALAGVLEATLEAMTRLGADRARISAAVGPCIGRASYEVAADLRDAVLARDPQDERLFLDGARPDRWQFDLAGYCAARLAAAGVTRVALLDADTCADPDRFFSHRRRTLAGGGPIGHQISLIRLP